MELLPLIFGKVNKTEINLNLFVRYRLAVYSSKNKIEI